VIGLFFAKKKQTLPKSLKVDIHSHLIPAIDDGSKSIDESLAIIEAMIDLGYQKIITTPHVMADTYRNSSQDILDGAEILKKALIQNNLSVELEVAAEYYMDDEFEHRLASDDILTFGENYLLFETSYLYKPMRFYDVIYEIKAKGYNPILAHPERYRYIIDPHKTFAELKELGVYLQLDINSLVGHYGKQAKDHAMILSKGGMIDFLGSDIHHIKQVDFLKKVLSTSEYSDIFDHNTILNDMLSR
jgi:tyrosine-protein phosphatase YwqE